MGLLSKIFNTDKLAYILREEEEFSVVAPKQWNVETLTVGDKITPDMWKDEHPQYDLSLQSKIVEITDIDTDINKTYYVVLAHKNWSLDYDLDIINNLLKPQYQVVPPLFESDDDKDFNVDAPAEWNVTELNKGDIITPDMWKDDLINWNHDVKIDGFKPYGSEVGFIVYLKHLDSNRTPLQAFELGEINDWLKNTYRVEVNGLMESEEDDFSVDAPAKWNVTDLEIGDYIYPEMINTPKDKRKWEYYHNMLADPKRTYGWQITGFKKHDGRDLVRLEYNGVGNFFDVDLINSTLKQYRIFPPTNETKLSSLLEMDDEFSVDAPLEWNQESLSTGDIITPNMWDKQKFFDDPTMNSIKVYNEAIEDSWIIESINYEEIDNAWFVNLKSSTTDHKYFGLWSDPEELNNINNVLKDNYKIYPPNTLLESDDEEDFSVDAPENWNVTELGIGSILDSSNLKMQDPMKKFEIVDFKISLFPWENNNIVLKVFQLKDEPIPGTNRTTRQWKYIRNIFVELKILNDRLKDGYKIEPSLNENDEDEFSVDAPQEWNVKFLTTGDTITPDMWDLNNSNLDNYVDNPNEDWIIDEVDGEDIEISTKVWGGEFWGRLKDINSVLKPGYRIVQNKDLFEGEEDFSVDAPQEWNVEHLTTGDTITPDMWDQSKIGLRKDFFSKPIKIDSIGYNEFDNEEEEPLVGLDLGDTTTEYDIDFVNYLLKPEFKVVQNKNLTEEEDFNVDASPEWNVIELRVGDYINSNMLNPKGNDYTWFSRRKLFIEDIFFDECWTVNLLHVESDYYTPFCIDYINEDVLNDKYRIMPSLNELLEIDDKFDVEAPQKWDVIELGVGDKITRDMIKSPGFLDQMDEDFRIDFPGVITEIDKYGPTDDDTYWGVRIKFQDIGWRKYLPQSENIKLGLGFSLDDFNEGVLKPQYQIQKPVFELSKLLENEEDFNVDAPQEWNIEYLTTGDTITPDMWGYGPGLSWFDISKPLNIEDIGEDDGGWWVQLGRNEAPFDLDEINEFLKSQYKIVPYNLEESDNEFNVDAPEEWNDEYWEPTESKEDENYIDSFDKFVRSVLKKQRIEDEIIESYLDEIYRSGDLSVYEGISSSKLIKDFFLWTEAENDGDDWFNGINEEEEDFSVDAPEEWNITQLGVNDVITPDMWSKKGVKISLIINKIEKRGIIDGYEIWEIHMRPYGSKLQNNEKSSIIVDLNDVQNYLKPEYKITKNKVIFEEEEDFSVDAPEDWWEYDGDVELMFQDTYWYEDKNGKEAIIERDGGGIVNINDLEQYSYSGWKPFIGNPTDENLTKWYYSINWDTDLIEMFNFDDSVFEAEEDFDWSTAENIDMDRTYFRIRAVSILKEVDDEFTVKAPKKWDIVYLNKGDFLDNTNSTFNDPNVKYEIGNITSDGEIEVKKYINRGSGFEPQFDRFMKTRKGIVKAKLKPGFDIESFSK